MQRGSVEVKPGIPFSQVSDSAGEHDAAAFNLAEKLSHAAHTRKRLSVSATWLNGMTFQED